MKVWLVRLGKYVVLPLVCAIAGIAIGALLYREVAQRDIAARRTITAPEGIEVLETVTIGGVEQWLSIRGQNRSAPILLYVHGGPGSAMMPFAHGFQDPLEHHFVVVQWDQRGAGKSRRGGDDFDGVTVDRMVEDVLEVTRHLRERFNRDKIVLLGHSWGTILGVHAILREPDYYSAYVGVGQVVNMHENETVSYRYVTEEAERREDQTGIEALAALAPYPDSNADEFVEKIGVQRRWLIEYDGAIRIPGGLKTIGIQLFTAPEYSLSDCVNWFRGNFEAVNHFWADLMSVDFTETTNFDVPMFIVSGTYDYQVPFELAEAWFESLRAPHKEFLWVHNAAHMPMASQPDAFAGLLERRVLPVAAKSNDAGVDKQTSTR